MTQNTAIDRERTAVVIMDFPNGNVDRFATDPQGVLERAAQVLQGARRAGLPVIYTVHGRKGHTPDEHALDFDPRLDPGPDEAVLVKTKTGAFSTTGLDVILRGMGRDILVLIGISTRGCVLSTARWASDINYSVMVVSDACDNPDPEVHRILVEKVLPMTATVLTTREFLDAFEN